MNNDEKKERFSKLRKMMGASKYGKAKSEAEASKNPMKFMEANKNMKINGKGVAF